MAQHAFPRSTAALHKDDNPIKPYETGYWRDPEFDFETSLASEVDDCRSISDDLIRSVFGSIIPEDRLPDILRLLVEAGILRVRKRCDDNKRRKQKEKRERPVSIDVDAASRHAQLQARCKAGAGESNGMNSAPEDRFTWAWTLETSTETETAFFLNVVSIASFAAAVKLGILPRDGPEFRPPSLRFTSLSDTKRPLPLGDPCDRSPKILAFDSRPVTGASHRADSKDCKERPSEVVRTPDSNNPFIYLRMNHPRLFDWCARELPTETSTSPRLHASRKRRKTSSCALPRKRPALDTEHTRERVDEAGRDLSGSTTPQEGTTSDANSALSTFVGWFKDQEQRNYLDLARVCWPEVELPGEVGLTDTRHTLLQVLAHLRQQRRSQPWMRSVMGLLSTQSQIGLVRADALGVEQCFLDKDSSRGAFEIVRLLLGVVLATPEQRGYHPAFKLSLTRTLGPRVHATSSKRRCTNSSTTTSSSLEMEYRHRQVHFIELGTEKLNFVISRDKDRDIFQPTGPTTRYYVHYTLKHRGSLVGRCQQLFCVSRELTRPEAAYFGFSDEQRNGRCFLGPYVLKLYYAATTSDCHKHGIIKKLAGLRLDDVLLPERVWTYGDTLNTIRGFDETIVRNHENDTGPIIPGVHGNREEIFDESEMKPTLAQFSKDVDLVDSFINVAQGIYELNEAGYVHRDISPGNILLAREPRNEEFFQSAERDLREALGVRNVYFRQREPLGRQRGGWLHDLDMAGLRDDRPARKLEISFLKNVRISVPFSRAQKEDIKPVGTLACVACDLMRDGPPHRASHDVHSMLFAQISFFLDYDGMQPLPAYPARIHDETLPWPAETHEWTTLGLPKFRRLGRVKQAYFGLWEHVMEEMQRWCQGRRWQEAHFFWWLWQSYKHLWQISLDRISCREKQDITPLDMVALLQKVKTEHAEFNM